ncbi:endopeptidase La [Spirochaeta isovalerica]|uniref:Lon protease n=1 Tax=Spirochaeta isovalerica TaxID=150 RepID=A0A841REV1_9SPIO|nr:endopeptidase La [Spirochaeta isovalerica]MBB6481737.1 ATP-dependent Lon protease [Spirochaeta isovalerica]
MINYGLLPDELPLIPVKGSVIFPGSDNNIRISGLEPGDTFNKSEDGKDTYAIALSMRRNFNLKELEEDDFYKVGTMVRVLDKQKTTDGYKILTHAVERVQIHKIRNEKGIYYAEFTLLLDEMDLERSNQLDLLTYVKDISTETARYFQGSENIIKKIEEFEDSSSLIYYIAPYLNISRSEKQELLEITSVRERGMKFLDYLIRQKESIKIQAEMAQKVNEKANKSYRESILREQLKSIQEELNDGKKSKGETLKEKIEGSLMPEDVRQIALEELEKLEAQGPNGSDSHVIRNYLDLLIALPWKQADEQDIDINLAREILDRDHYGLEKVKERIIQHLAVMKLKKGRKGSILLLVGPPGTGKTSLGKSVAGALNRQFVRISLGGIRDEADIRGHRRTYVGALPGRIIQGMKKAGETNPVFMLDEVDKVMRGFSGDPASALLEVLDPEQNNSFSDHYLEVPYDLSDVFFIATANSIETIPGPLLDRMEVIHISGYTNHEKFYIGKQHLIPRVLEEHGLDDGKLIIDDEALTEVIENYTREAGVRTLKRKLDSLARISSEKVVSGKEKLPYHINAGKVEEFLGRERVRHAIAEADNPPGVVTGLAWTPVGGEILFIESTNMPGTGQLTLTGQMGDVMKESAQISRSLIRSRLTLFAAGFSFNENDLHIHIPSGAVPKDGPSAGITLFTSLASLVTGRKVDPKLAMTGEITLRGSVMPIGGLKEKVLAAHRAGIKKILIPDENKKDLEDVPREIKEELEFKAVYTVEEVIQEALGITLPRFGANGPDPDKHEVKVEK